jgi:hypothetical protein
MRFLNDFKIFEAKFIKDRDLIDYHIINDLKDILLELDDEGLESRIWVNDVRYDKGSQLRIGILEEGNKFKNELVALGYSWNREIGQSKAVLWQTSAGGNHFSHVHVSRRS